MGLAGLGLALLGVLTRSLQWRHVFGGDQTILIGVDSWYHLHRARLLFEAFPDSPRTDAYLSFPTGAPIPWPPGFDALLALPAVLAGDPTLLAPWAALLMPLLGGSAVWLTWRLGRRAFDPVVALGGAAWMALVNGALHPTLLGRADHHGLVAPLTLATYLTFLASTEATTRGRAVTWGLACGGLAALAVGSWIVTPPIYFLPIPIVSAVLLWRGQTRLRAAALSTCTSAAVGVTAVVLATGDLAARPFSLYQPSAFAISLYAAVAGWVALAAWRPRALWPATFVGLGTLAATLALAPDLVPPLRDALAVVRGADLSYQIGWEIQPLFSHEGVFTIERALHLYSPLFFALPFAMAAYARSALRRREPGRAVWLALAFGSWGMILVCTQQRFGEYASPALALFTSYAVVESMRHIRRRLGDPPLPFARTALASFGAILLVACVSPALTTLRDGSARDPVPHERSLVAFASALRAHTPEPVERGGRPDYGVLAGWNDSHALLATARRPIAASSFATQEALAGNRIAFGILLAHNEDLAVERMLEAHLRFLVVSPIESEVQAMAAIAGIDERFFEIEVGRDATGAFKRYWPRRPFAEALHTRLLLGDGSDANPGGVATRGLGHFRLHLESPDRVRVYGMEVPRFKAFEAVAGARLHGRAPAGAIVRAELPIRTNTGRTFTFTRETRADTEGHYAFVLPYSTETAPSPCVALGPYSLTISGDARTLHVPELAVLRGDSLEATLAHTPRAQEASPASLDQTSTGTASGSGRS